MSRKPLFLIYGLVAGVFWAIVVNRAAANTLAPATIWIVILAILFGLLGWHWAGSSEISNKQLLLLPILPFVFLASVCGMVVFFVILGLISPFLVFKEQRRQRQFRKRMKSEGRFITINDLRPQLDEGKGTLIVEYRLKGPQFVWWTKDDLSVLGEPVSVDEEIRAIIEQQEHAFNSRCRTEYLNAEIGKASITSIPPRWAKTMKLSDIFPKVKIVTVVQLVLPEGIKK